MNKNTLLYAGLIIFGLAGAFIFPAYKLQLSFLYILIVLAMTWDVQGGQMGYNTFGNILFFGIGMYVCSGVQIGMFKVVKWVTTLLAISYFLVLECTFVQVFKSVCFLI